jgi:hypothetical protein
MQTKAHNCQHIIFVISYKKSGPGVLFKGLRKQTKSLICHNNVYFISTKSILISRLLPILYGLVGLILVAKLTNQRSPGHAKYA